MSTHDTPLLQIEQAFRRGDWHSVLQAAAEQLPAHSGEPRLHYLAGLAHLEMKSVPMALRHLHRAARLRPDDPDYLAQYARAFSMARLIRESLEVAELALTKRPERAATLDTIGTVFSYGNLHERAIDVFCAAVSHAPDHAPYRYNLAASLLFNGRGSEAAAELERCTAIDPRCWQAYLMLSQVKRQQHEHNHVARLEALLRDYGQDRGAEVYLNMALAKEYEDLGDYPAAYARLVSGKSAAARDRSYRPGRDRALTDALIAAFPTPPAASQGCSSDEPIFVIGMPRSGTTLVERILSSHPAVQSAGELEHFSVALKRASGSRTPAMLDADTIARAAVMEDWRGLGQSYVDSTRPLTGGRPHFIDKLPHNFHYVGFIARALPRARIICLWRDPMDVCLGNFRQLFALTSPYYDYSFDLLDIGRYYLEFERLMIHWHRMFPGRILDLQYEQLVGDQEDQTRRLLDHCGLEWDDACLHFERNTAPVSTASLVQVRSPMYSSSIGRWRYYEEELEPLRALLAAGSSNAR